MASMILRNGLKHISNMWPLHCHYIGSSWCLTVFGGPGGSLYAPARCVSIRPEPTDWETGCSTHPNAKRRVRRNTYYWGSHVTHGSFWTLGVLFWGPCMKDLTAFPRFLGTYHVVSTHLPQTSDGSRPWRYCLQMAAPLNWGLCFCGCPCNEHPAIRGLNQSP